MELKHSDMKANNCLIAFGRKMIRRHCNYTVSRLVKSRRNYSSVAVRVDQQQQR